MLSIFAAQKNMKTLLTTLLVSLASMSLASTSRAESIGHAEFQIGEPWAVLTSYDTSLTYDNGVLVIPVHNKVFYIPGPDGVPKALLTVSSTETRIPGRVRWVSEICPDARPKFFTEDHQSNKQTRVRECLVVNSSFAPLLFYRPDSELAQAAKEKGISLFKSGYSFRSVYGANGGALVRVHLATTRAFRGSPTAPESEQLHDVAPELVAWGEALHAAVRKSASSLSGELVLPAIEFGKSP